VQLGRVEKKEKRATEAWTSKESLASKANLVPEVLQDLPVKC